VSLTFLKNIEDRKMKLQEQVDKILKLTGSKPGLFHVEILHDDWCPALKTQRLIDCTCNPIIRRMKVDA
jgi:hypothetical protein